MKLACLSSVILCILQSFNLNSQTYSYDYFAEICDSLMYHEIDNHYKDFFKLDTITFRSENFSQEDLWLKLFEPIRKNIRDTSLNLRIHVSYIGVKNTALDKNISAINSSFKIRYKLVMLDGCIYKNKKGNLNDLNMFLREIKSGLAINKQAALVIGEDNMPKANPKIYTCYLTYDKPDHKIYWVVQREKRGLRKIRTYSIYIDPFNGRLVKAEEETNLRLWKVKRKRKPYRSGYTSIRFD